jgi:hypothetical protein
MTPVPTRSVLQTRTTPANHGRLAGEKRANRRLRFGARSGVRQMSDPPTIVARSVPELVGTKIQLVFNLASAGSQETMTVCERWLFGMLDLLK